MKRKILKKRKREGGVSVIKYFNSLFTNKVGTLWIPKVNFEVGYDPTGGFRSIEITQ